MQALKQKLAGYEGAGRALEAQAAGIFEQMPCVHKPFKHWLFGNAFPLELSREIIKLPINPSSIVETYGKRDSHNDVRRFFSPDMQTIHPVMQAIAALFQSSLVVRALEKSCGVNLSGSFLRIEYCQDKQGFWLEPHRDIKEKRMTMQIYLNTDEDAATLGTDLYDNNKKPFSTAPSIIGQGMIFIPSEPESWHGFEKRPIKGIRRSLIINYVDDDWRAVHELAFPGQRVE